MNLDRLDLEGKCISVEDNGKGMNREQLENSFRELVLGLKVHEISDVIHTHDNELVVFMICDRRKLDADIPSLKKLKEAEFNKLYSVLSLRYLMRLRRAASIEIKIK